MPKNLGSGVRSSFLPQQTVAQTQILVIIWSMLHILSFVCLSLGIYFAIEYMKMPDHVWVIDKAGNIFYGKTNPVLCREAAEDIATKAAHAFLDRSFVKDNRTACEALFGRTAQRSLRSIIAETADEFKEQQIRQVSVIEKVEIFPADTSDQCLAFVSGTLHRTGVYMSIPYYQKLEFTLGLRLMRTPVITDYPLRVLKMTYNEKSIYHNKEEK